MYSANNSFGTNNSNMFGLPTEQPSNTLFGTNNSKMFGQQTEQPSNTLFGTNNSNMFGQQTEQPSNTLFGVKNTSNFPQSVFGQPSAQQKANTQINIKNNDTGNSKTNSQKIDKLLQQNETLNFNINELLKNLNELKSEKELCVVCPLHEHPLTETRCDKINNISYNNGFLCNICNSQIFDKNTIMYHCKTCMESGKLFDTCEKCIRKCLKVTI